MEAQDDIIFKMQRSNVLREFKVSIIAEGKKIEMGHLMGLDGFEYFRSKNICCQHCCQVHHRDGTIDYFHRTLIGAIHPSQVLQRSLPAFQKLRKGWAGFYR